MNFLYLIMNILISERKNKHTFNYFVKIYLIKNKQVRMYNMRKKYCIGLIMKIKQIIM